MNRWAALGLCCLIASLSCSKSVRDLGASTDGGAGTDGGGAGTSSSGTSSSGNSGTGSDAAGSPADGGDSGQPGNGVDGGAGGQGGTAGAEQAAAGEAGAGTPSNPCAHVMCPAATACHAAGECDLATGQCSAPVPADHTSCGASVECLAGTCQCTLSSCPNGCCSGAGVCGACTPQTLSTRLASVGSLTVGPSFLYFVETPTGQASDIYALPKAGGSAAFLSLPSPPREVRSIVADGSFIYGGAPFSAAGRMPILGGGYADLMGSPGTVDQLRTNTSRVVVGATLSSNYIFSFPKTGAMSATQLVASTAVDYRHFAVDDSFVYVIAGGTAVSRIPVAGGDSVDVAPAAAGESLNDLSLSGAQLIAASSTRVAKVAAAGGALVTLSAGAAYAVVSDASSAFFFRTKDTAGGCAGGSELYSIPVAGGTLRRLAVEPSTTCATSVVQDATAVYWLIGNVIKKAAK